MEQAGRKHRTLIEVRGFLLPLALATLVGIGANRLDLFEKLHAFGGVHEAFTLAFVLCFALLMTAVHMTLRLRREIVAREKAEDAAQALARHDPLTGLPNRRVLLERLGSSIHRARTGSVQFAVFLIDLDRFKPINDVHGHLAGDFVLCQIAERLKALCPGEATVARLGGDGFAIVTESESHLDDAVRLAQRAIVALSAPVIWNTAELTVGATIGMAVCPVDGLEAEALLRAADIAMYRAKRDGRGRFCFFEQSMDHELQERAALESDLRTSLTQGLISPHYQPLVSLPDQTI